jgi:OOP family OmpA-OmpF porin
MASRLTVCVLAFAAVGITMPALIGCAKKVHVVVAEAPQPPPPAPAAPPPPAPPPAPVVQEKIELPGELQFGLNSARIKNTTENKALLAKLASILAQNAHITKLRIEGHTDNIGTAAHNQVLSQERAEAVLRWLGAHEIDRERLTAVGFGNARPIVDNDTLEHRKMNRRTEFHVQELDGKAIDDGTAKAGPAPVAQQDAAQ